MGQITEYYTYILECADGTFYIGMTKNIANRILQHNGTIGGGAKYTRNKRPVILRYYEKLSTFKAAAQRELNLKKLPRLKKILLCDTFTCKV